MLGIRQGWVDCICRFLKKDVTVLREKDLVKLQNTKSARMSYRKIEVGSKQVLERHEGACCHQSCGTRDSVPRAEVGGERKPLTLLSCRGYA